MMDNTTIRYKLQAFLAESFYGKQEVSFDTSAIDIGHSFASTTLLEALETMKQDGFLANYSLVGISQLRMWKN